MNIDKKQARYIVFIIWGFFFVFVITFSMLWIYFGDVIIGYDKELAHKMESISKGMTREEVINLLGIPLSFQDGPMKKGECLYYENEIDSWGKFCIDNDDMVYFVEYVGGT